MKLGKMMQTILVGLGLTIGAMLMTGCETDAQTGALIGAGIGAAAGAGLDHNNRGRGAAIGAGVGAAGGYMAGNESDKKKSGQY